MRALFPAALLLITSPAAALPLIQCELDKLASNDSDAADAFGAAVAVSGARALVGAVGDNGSGGSGGLDTGAAYVFDTTPTGLQQSAKLVAVGLGAGGAFGTAVALDGGTAVVTTGQGPKGTPGAAYVFDFGPAGWSQTAQLPGSGLFGAFGSSASLAQQTAVIGASGNILPIPVPGFARVYERSGAAWVNTATLRAAPPVVFTADEFGRSVSMTVDRVLVGASHFGSGSYGFDGAGAAHVFDRNDNGTPGNPLDDSWPLTATLRASDGALGDLFGWSVSLSGNTAIVGAPHDDDAGASSGAAYVFELSALGWTEVAKLTALDAAAGDEFGFSVAGSGQNALIGAPADDDAGDASGSVYVFERLAAGWSQSAKHGSSDAAPGDGYGSAVDLDGDLGLVAAPGDEDGGSNSGSAYSLSVSGAGCPLFLASPGEISLASGGDQDLVLTAGPAHAGRLYLVLGSATGTSPGFVHGGFQIPLNIDAYFALVLSSPNAPPFLSFLGFLGQQGTAQAQLALPPGLDASLAGLALHHAWVAFDPATASLALASSAKQLVLVP